MRYMDVTRQVIGAAFEIHNSLGSGFLEKVYENALVLELRSIGLTVHQQHPIPVRYKNQYVGEYFADLLVNENVICEIKAVDVLIKQHELQLVHYLTATGFETGLLLNFGQSVSVRRKFLKYKNPVNSEKSL